jgi:TM2 domain-containing membrane protein YozV
VAFDGAGKPYRSGPSWGCALIIVVGTIVGIVLALGLILPLILD